MMGEPVSRTFWPRTRPSVPSMAMVRTVFSLIGEKRRISRHGKKMRTEKIHTKAQVGRGNVPEVLGDLEHEARAVVLDLERVEDGREAIVELHVDDGTDDGADLADADLGRRCVQACCNRNNSKK